MVNKDPIKISSIVITFVIVLTGAVLCYWLYANVIEKPSVTDDNTTTSIEVKKDKLRHIQEADKATVETPDEGYGRPNPFLPYK